MTDFLSRLVERSAGRADVARPVVPPLFAAGAPLAADPVEEADAAAGGLPAAGSEVGAGEAPRPARGGGEASRPSVERSSPVPTRLPRLTPSERRSRAVARATTGEGPTRPSLTPDVVSPPAGPLARPDGAPEAASEAATSAERGGVVGPRDVVSFQRVASPEPAPSRPEPAPIVRISIGRIDVRAVPPARPAPPSATSVRKDDRLSLEEYLRPRDRRR